MNRQSSRYAMFNKLITQRYTLGLTLWYANQPFIETIATAISDLITTGVAINIRQ